MRDTELTFRPLSTVTGEAIRKYVAQTGVLVLRVGKWKVRVVEVVEDEVFEKRIAEGGGGWCCGSAAWVGGIQAEEGWRC